MLWLVHSRLPAALGFFRFHILRMLLWTDWNLLASCGGWECLELCLHQFHYYQQKGVYWTYTKYTYISWLSTASPSGTTLVLSSDSVGSVRQSWFGLCVPAQFRDKEGVCLEWGFFQCWYPGRACWAEPGVSLSETKILAVRKALEHVKAVFSWCSELPCICHVGFSVTLDQFSFSAVENPSRWIVVLKSLGNGQLYIVFSIPTILGNPKPWACSET